MSEKLCVVMPVYNEQEAIGPVLEKWAKALDALGIDYAIRPYNDGSKDNSLAVMKETAAHLPHVDVHDKKNGGHGNTILTGYRDAAADGFDWVFQIDSDDEMGPEKFGELWAKRGEHDFLVGIRDGRVQQLQRKIISFVSRLCVRLFYGKSVWDVNTPYRLMRVSAFKEFYHEIPLTTFAPNVILSGLAARHNLRSYEIRVPQHDRTTGEVSIKRWKLLKAAAKSFGQTILFALRADGIARLICRSFVLLGVVYSIFPLLDARNLTMALGAFGVLCLFRMHVMKLLDRLIGFVERNCIFSLWMIFTVGIILRVCEGWLWGFLQHPLPIYTPWNDSWVILQQAKSVAGGTWVENKAWVPVLFYGGLIRLFGVNGYALIVGNVFLNVVTGLLLYKISRMLWCPVVGVIAFAFWFLTPDLAHHSLFLATEHACFLFVTISMWLFMRICAVKSPGRALINLFFASVTVWLAVWSRGESFVLWGAFVFVIACSRRTTIYKKLAALFVVALGFGLGATFALHVNNSIDNPSIFCSNDSWWPRLHGACVENGGVMGGGREEVTRIFHERFPEKEFKYELGYCPREMVPIIQEEIRRRWHEMTVLTAGKFIVKKLLLDYGGKKIYKGEGIFGRATVFVFANSITVVICCLSLVFFLKTASNNEEVIAFGLMPLVILIGNSLVLSIAEALPRYGYILYVALTPYAARGLVGMVGRNNAMTCRTS